MDPDRLEFLKEMLKRREDSYSDFNTDWWELANEYRYDSLDDYFEDPGYVRRYMEPKGKKLRRDHIKQMFDAEDARSLSMFGKSGKIEDLLWHAQNSRRPGRFVPLPQHTVGSVRRLLDRAKGITSLIPEKPFYPMVLAPLAAALGLAFDHATAADELGAGEDEFLRQMKGDTGDLTEEEMMQYYNALLGHD
tara:strand:- start:405 stop:980 length:576 start_codon:yes stop_codon:yes gene_type:complete